MCLMGFLGKGIAAVRERAAIASLPREVPAKGLVYGI